MPRDEGSRHCPDGMTYDLVLMVSGDRRHAEELRQEVTSMRLRLHPVWSAAVCAAQDRCSSQTDQAAMPRAMIGSIGQPPGQPGAPPGRAGS